MSYIKPTPELFNFPDFKKSFRVEYETPYKKSGKGILQMTYFNDLPVLHFLTWIRIRTILERIRIQVKNGSANCLDSVRYTDN